MPTVEVNLQRPPDHEIKLFHFTGLAALIGEESLVDIRPGDIDLATVAGPGSIIAGGLKPRVEAGYDGVLRSPLPPCVWLTDDPDMDDNGLHFSRFADFRIALLIPRNDQRLQYWPEYFRNHGRCTLPEAMEKAGVPEAAQRTAETFYVYFGEITRFVTVERVAGRGSKLTGRTLRGRRRGRARQQPRALSRVV